MWICNTRGYVSRRSRRRCAPRRQVKRFDHLDCKGHIVLEIPQTTHGSDRKRLNHTKHEAYDDPPKIARRSSETRRLAKHLDPLRRPHASRIRCAACVLIHEEAAPRCRISVRKLASEQTASRACCTTSMPAREEIAPRRRCSAWTPPRELPAPRTRCVACVLAGEEVVRRASNIMCVLSVKRTLEQIRFRW